MVLPPTAYVTVPDFVLVTHGHGRHIIPATVIEHTTTGIRFRVPDTRPYSADLDGDEMALFAVLERDVAQLQAQAAAIAAAENEETEPELHESFESEVEFESESEVNAPR